MSNSSKPRWSRNRILIYILKHGAAEMTTKKRTLRWRPGVVHRHEHTHPPTLLQSPYGPSPERKSYQGGMYVFYVTRVWVCVWVRPVNQSGNRRHINLICHNLSLETLWPPPHTYQYTHTHTLTPSCVLSVSATDRESEANYMWELRRWKQDKDRVSVSVYTWLLLGL